MFLAKNIHFTEAAVDILHKNIVLTVRFLVKLVSQEFAAASKPQPKVRRGSQSLEWAHISIFRKRSSAYEALRSDG